MSLNAMAQRRLRIDADRAIERIEAFIRRVCRDHGASGALVGLSGGVDSALLAALAVRALGRRAVHVVHLAAPGVDPAARESARRIADQLGLELAVIDTASALRRRGLCRSRLQRALGFLPRGTVRAALRLYRLAEGEPWFVSRLRRGDLAGRPFARLAMPLAIEPVSAAQKARHRHRREILEARAEALGAVLLGAGNRSELLTGFFTVGAIDDVPVSPLLGLYKTQVRQLAGHVGLPRSVCRRLAASGAVGRVTDEMAMAASYAAIDLVLDALESGTPGGDGRLGGLEPEIARRILLMHRLSAWKRTSPHLPPPADGSLDGGLRVDAEASAGTSVGPRA